MLRREQKRYFENDFGWSEHEKVCIKEISELKSNGKLDDKYFDVERQGIEVWNKFYDNHRIKFFKPKMYLPEAYPEIIDYIKTLEGEFCFIDYGCGHGGSSISFLMDIFHFKPKTNFTFVGFDTSLTALKDCNHFLLSKYSNIEQLSFQLTCVDLSKDKVAKSIKGNVGIMIFTLSAVPPTTFDNVLENLSVSLCSGSIIALRDYGLYDMVHMRCLRKGHKKIKTKLKIPTFEKVDGVLVTFFTLEFLETIFKKHKFEVVRLQYSMVELKNKKTLEKMRRVFVSGIFRKL